MNNLSLDNLHFFAASVYEWRTTTPTCDLRDLIKAMDANKMSYSLWLVPLPHDAPYDINFYAPQVAGAQELALFQFKNGRKVANVSKGE